MSSRKLTMSIVAGVVAIAVAGCSSGIVSATSSSTSPAATSSSGGGGSNARSGPAAGGHPAPSAACPRRASQSRHQRVRR